MRIAFIALVLAAVTQAVELEQPTSVSAWPEDAGTSTNSSIVDMEAMLPKAPSSPSSSTTKSGQSRTPSKSSSSSPFKSSWSPSSTSSTTSSALSGMGASSSHSGMGASSSSLSASKSPSSSSTSSSHSGMGASSSHSGMGASSSSLSASKSPSSSSTPTSGLPVSVGRGATPTSGLTAPVVASKGAPIVRTSGHAKQVAQANDVRKTNMTKVGGNASINQPKTTIVTKPIVSKVGPSVVSHKGAPIERTVGLNKRIAYENELRKKNMTKMGGKGSINQPKTAIATKMNMNTPKLGASPVGVPVAASSAQPMMCFKPSQADLASMGSKSGVSMKSQTGSGSMVVSRAELDGVQGWAVEPM